MRLKLISLCFFSLFLFGFTQDVENISVDISRTQGEAIAIKWDITNDDYETIFLEIKHKGFFERYELANKTGQIELCCFPEEVTVYIITQNTVLVDITDGTCNAETCVELKKVEYFNFSILESIPPTTIKIETTTTSTTTTTTSTTTTLPPVLEETLLEETHFFDTIITNPLIKNIPLFSDVDFNNQQQNALVVVISTFAIFLFYLVLIVQEWFNKLLGEKTKKYTQNSSGNKGKLITFSKVVLVLLITAFLLGYVEEGADLTLDIENLAIFFAALVGLVVVTFSYEGIEGLIEKYIYKQLVQIRWSPQAILFALLSTITFIIFKLPVGFIFGFFATSQIVYSRSIVKISPKFFASVFLAFAGFLFFYLTSIEVVLNSPVLTAVAALTYLMCLEGAVFKSIPGGGNELIESINDSEGLYKIFSLISFFISVWLFLRILILTEGSEYFKMQEELVSLGPSLFKFLVIVIAYIFILLFIGFLVKRKVKLEK